MLVKGATDGTKASDDYLNQCCLSINGILWNSLRATPGNTNHNDTFNVSEKHALRITSNSPGIQWAVGISELDGDTSKIMGTQLLFTSTPKQHEACLHYDKL